MSTKGEQKGKIVQFVPKKEEFITIVEEFVRTAGGEEATKILLIGVQNATGEIILATNCKDELGFSLIALTEWAKKAIMENVLG